MRRRLTRDRVRIAVRGADPQRVLSAGAAQGIQILKASPVEDYCSFATISSGHVGMLREIASKMQCEVETVRHSIPGRFLRKGARRKRLALLLCAACLLAWLSSLFVWEIRVVGNERVSDAEILRALADCGVTVGTFWPDTNIDLIRSGVQLRVPELGWFTINLHGSVAEVRVTERVEAPEPLDNDTPVSLVAACDGVVTRMSILQGQPLVQRGDFAAAGQELVTGAPEDLQGERRGVHALGSVRARTAYSLTAAAPLTVLRAVPDGNTHTRLALLVGKKTVFFGKSSSIPGAVCDKLYSVSVCAVPGWVRLPFSLLRERSTALAVTETALDPETVRARLEQTLLDALRDRIGADGEVISKSFSVTESEGMLLVTLRCECEQEIAVEQPCQIPKLPKGSGDHE